MKQRRFHIVAAVFPIIGALFLSGCAASSAQGTGKTFTIGYAALSMKDQVTAEMAKTLEDNAPNYGARVDAIDSNSDVSTELNNIEDMIARHDDAIIMQPVDGKASQAAAKQVIAAGIPLFVISTEFAAGSNIGYKAHIGVDDTTAGELQAEYLDKILPNGGNIALLAGTYGASWTDRRMSGFKSKLDGNIHVAVEFQANGNRDQAKTNMEDVLQRFPHPGDLVAVAANNDEMALGAVSAIDEVGRGSDFKAIIGVDGTDGALAAIGNGTMTATVKQDQKAQAVKTLQVISDYMHGKPIEKSYDLPFTVVTKQNLAQFQK